MDNKNVSIKEKIILAAINCIEKYGMHSVTIRKIAKEANVNIAAINYHFNNKDKLISEALKQTLKEAFTVNLEENFLNNEQDIYKALYSFFLDTIEGALNYPEIIKAHLYRPFIYGDYQSEFVEKFNNFLEDLLNRCSEQFKDTDENEIRFSIIQVVSAVLLPIMFPNLFENFLKQGIDDPSLQKSYIQHLLSHFLRIK